MRPPNSFTRPDPIGGAQLPVQAAETARTAMAARGQVPPAPLGQAQQGRVAQGLPAGAVAGQARAAAPMAGSRAGGYVPTLPENASSQAKAVMAARTAGSRPTPAAGANPGAVVGTRTGQAMPGGLYSRASQGMGQPMAPQGRVPTMAGPAPLMGGSRPDRLAGWFNSRGNR